MMFVYRLAILFISMLLWVRIAPLSSINASDEMTITTCDFATLKAAIATLEADAGGIITLDCTGTIRFTEKITIASDITIKGTESTILDGYGEFTLFFVTGTLTLDTLTIQKAWTAVENRGNLTVINSLFDDNLAFVYGAAITNWAGMVSITNTEFIRNETDDGGAIFNVGGTMTITDSAFSINRAYSAGGAIRNNGTMTITNSTFDQNRATNGGAIINGSKLTIRSSQFTQNHAHYHGGVIYNLSDLTIQDSQFTQNHADVSGGAIYARDKMVILDSQFIENDSLSSGAIFTNNTLSIRNSYFEGNRATFSDGGAISQSRSSDSVVLNVSHNVFVNNHAMRFGGAIIYRGMAVITNNTFFDNEAQMGGALYGNDESSATIVHNTFVDNEGVGAGIYVNSPTQIQYNLLSGTPQTQSQCSGLHVQDVDATNLTDYQCGGAGQVDDFMLGEFDGRIFPLVVGSPAIDAYPQPCQMSRDQLGMLRPYADGCDVGAVEWSSEGAVAITEPQQISLTECTWDMLYAAFIQLNWSGGNIRLDCPAETTIVFDVPFTIYNNLTIISENPILFDGDNQTQLFIVDIMGSLTLEGIRIINGYHPIGGAIRNDGTLHLREMTFSENESESGGAIFNNGDMTIADSHFEHNRAEVGGAIYSQGKFTISNSTFMFNQAGQPEKITALSKPLGQYYAENFDQAGGAIFNNNVSTINTTVFEGNSAVEAGGAILIGENGELVVTNSVFRQNQAELGGALYFSYNPRYRFIGYNQPDYLAYQTSTDKTNDYAKSVLQMDSDNDPNRVVDNLFQENSATNAGAIFGGSWLTINRNQFIRNRATRTGGAVHYGNSEYIYVVNNTFLENSADMGGALYRTPGTNNTFIRNSAITQGGAVYSGWIEAGTFIGNTAPEGATLFETPTNRSIIVEGDGECGELQIELGRTGNIHRINLFNVPCMGRDADLLLGEFDGRVIPLLAGSLAIDQVDCNNTSEHDQLGTPRPQGDKCDLGAVEFMPDEP